MGHGPIGSSLFDLFDPSGYGAKWYFSVWVFSSQNYGAFTYLCVMVRTVSTEQ